MPQLPLEIENGLRELAEHCAQNGDRVWGYFQENVLNKENHVLDDRFNLITLATCPLDNTSLRSLVSAEHKQQWHVLRGDARDGCYVCIHTQARTHTCMHARTHAHTHTHIVP